MTPAEAYARLMDQTQGLLAEVPDLRDFAGDGLVDLEQVALPPRGLPVLPELIACTARTAPQTQALAQTIRTAAPLLHWKQSYTKSQVGVAHLLRYGWFNLVSPEGPFVSADFRVSVRSWGQGLVYPRHRHDPEEIYCVLAGGAVFETEGRPVVVAGPGTLVHHPSAIWHGMQMVSEPLLALAVWKGDRLLAKSQIEAIG